jgi:hypothetical protein
MNQISQKLLKKITALALSIGGTSAFADEPPLPRYVSCKMNYSVQYKINGEIEKKLLKGPRLVLDLEEEDSAMSDGTVLDQVDDKANDAGMDVSGPRSIDTV